MIDDVISYYNSSGWINKKIKEHINGNERVDKCLNFFKIFITENQSVKDVLEIGCSIGLTTVELAKSYPKIKFTGLDIANNQIEFAKNNFNLFNADFICADITDKGINKKFDLITLFDIYEHIKLDSRKKFNLAISHLLSHSGSLIITCPSWIISKRNQQDKPELLQVVDEVVTIEDYIKLADDIGGTLTYLKLISVWESFDYCHCIISKESPLKVKKKARRKISLLERLKIKLGISERQLRIKRRRDILKSMKIEN